MSRKRTLGKGSRVAMGVGKASPVSASMRPPKATSDDDLRSMKLDDDARSDSGRLSQLRRLQSMQSAAVDRTSRAVGASRTSRGRSRSR